MTAGGMTALCRCGHGDLDHAPAPGASTGLWWAAPRGARPGVLSGGTWYLRAGGGRPPRCQA